MRALLALALLLTACATPPAATPGGAQVEVVHMLAEDESEGERDRLERRALEWVRRWEAAHGPLGGTVRIELWRLPCLPHLTPAGDRGGPFMGLTWVRRRVIMLAVQGNRSLRYLGHELAHIHRGKSDRKHRDRRWKAWNRWDRETAQALAP